MTSSDAASDGPYPYYAPCASGKNDVSPCLVDSGVSSPQKYCELGHRDHLDDGRRTQHPDCRVHHGGKSGVGVNLCGWRGRNQGQVWRHVIASLLLGLIVPAQGRLHHDREIANASVIGSWCVESRLAEVNYIVVSRISHKVTKHLTTHALPLRGGLAGAASVAGGPFTVGAFDIERA